MKEAGDITRRSITQFYTEDGGFMLEFIVKPYGESGLAYKHICINILHT